MTKRKIAVITGSRAEYGLMYWLCRALAEDPEIEFQLIVTAMHLSNECGLTYQQIEADGFHIDKKIEMLLACDSASGITKSMGLGLIGFADAYAELKPDLIVVLGDRFELISAVSAALIAKIPVAHIHGGELTQGAIDDGIRHAITKLSHIHFPAARPYAERIIQMGEQPDFVFNYGAPGLDHVKQTPLFSKQELSEMLDFEFGKQNFLVTYHPTTLGEMGADVEVDALLAALDHFEDAKVIFTYPNKEVESQQIIQKVNQYLEKKPHKGKCYISLGSQKYLSLVKVADCVVGNSSSGLIEVPLMQTPSVNIGMRQKGRLLASSVVQTQPNTADIIAAIQSCFKPEFQQQLAHIESPYGHGEVSLKIKNTLKEIDLQRILHKEFYHAS